MFSLELDSECACVQAGLGRRLLVLLHLRKGISRQQVLYNQHTKVVNLQIKHVVATGGYTPIPDQYSMGGVGAGDVYIDACGETIPV